MGDWDEAACRPYQQATYDNGRPVSIDGWPVMVPRTTEFFHAANGQLDLEHAKAVCASCSLSGIGGVCLDFAMENERDTTNDHGWRSGVWGGFGPGERVKLALSHPRYADRPTEPSDLEVDVLIEEITDDDRSGAPGSRRSSSRAGHSVG